MTIDEYSKQALTTLTGKHGCTDLSPALLSQIFGLVGESGEVAEKFKKLIRDKDGVLTDEDRQEILKELGDVVWYVNSITHMLGGDLTDVMQMNLDKLASRKKRNVIHGAGDNR